MVKVHKIPRMTLTRMIKISCSCLSQLGHKRSANLPKHYARGKIEEAQKKPYECT